MVGIRLGKFFIFFSRIVKRISIKTVRVNRKVEEDGELERIKVDLNKLKNQTDEVLNSIAESLLLDDTTSKVSKPRLHFFRRLFLLYKPVSAGGWFFLFMFYDFLLVGIGMIYNNLNAHLEAELPLLGLLASLGFWLYTMHLLARRSLKKNAPWLKYFEQKATP